MKHHWRAFAIPVGLVVLGAGCSDANGNGQDAAAPMRVSTSRPSSTALPSSSSVAVPSTSAGPTITSASPSTTSAPLSTTVDVQTEVRSAYLARQDAYVACVREPKLCDPTQLTAESGTARAALTKTVADLVAGGLHVGPVDPGYVVIEDAVVDIVAQRATLMVCGWDTAVLLGPPARPGDLEIVMNDLQVTKRLEVTMYQEAGRWTLGDEKALERVEGVNQCPPQS